MAKLEENTEGNKQVMNYMRKDMTDIKENFRSIDWRFTYVEQLLTEIMKNDLANPGVSTLGELY